jgi:hypothetical protein
MMDAASLTLSVAGTATLLDASRANAERSDLSFPHGYRPGPLQNRQHPTRRH